MGRGTTVKLISFVIEQLEFNLLVTVATTFCVFVLNGFGRLLASTVFPSSSIKLNDTEKSSKLCV